MRFEVRTDDYKHFGVWDTAAEAWRSETDLAPTVAERIETSLNTQIGMDGPRPPATVRIVSPPVSAEGRVIAQRWRPGRLDAWIKEADGWYGHLWFEDGGSGVGKWFHADRLRPGANR